MPSAALRRARKLLKSAVAVPPSSVACPPAPTAAVAAALMCTSCYLANKPARKSLMSPTQALLQCVCSMHACDKSSTCDIKKAKAAGTAEKTGGAGSGSAKLEMHRKDLHEWHETWAGRCLLGCSRGGFSGPLPHALLLLPTAQSLACWLYPAAEQRCSKISFYVLNVTCTSLTTAAAVAAAGAAWPASHRAAGPGLCWWSNLVLCSSSSSRQACNGTRVGSKAQQSSQQQTHATVLLVCVQAGGAGRPFWLPPKLASDHAGWSGAATG